MCLALIPATAFAADVTVTLNKTDYPEVNEEIVVTVSGVTAQMKSDGAWVGVYPQGGGHRDWDDYEYVNEGTGSYSLKLPKAKGNYEVRLYSFSSDPRDETLVTSVPFTVGKGECKLEIPTEKEFDFSGYNAPGSFSWTGTHSTNWGTMTLTQIGSSFTGNYTQDSGKITGTNVTGVLYGIWSVSPTYAPTDDAGQIVFIMGTDGKSFEGGWRYGSSGSWSPWEAGTRTSEVPATIPPTQVRTAAPLTDACAMRLCAGELLAAKGDDYKRVIEIWSKAFGIIPSGGEYIFAIISVLGGQYASALKDAAESAALAAGRGFADGLAGKAGGQDSKDLQNANRIKDATDLIKLLWEQNARRQEKLAARYAGANARAVLDKLYRDLEDFINRNNPDSGCRIIFAKARADRKNFTFLGQSGCKQWWTLNMDLRNDQAGCEAGKDQAAGTYTGKFILRAEHDMPDFASDPA
jgi:hypothetical protein